MSELEKVLEDLGITLGERVDNFRKAECPRCKAELHVHVARQFIHCFGCGVSLPELRRMRMRAV